jgi:hypothetical protein
MPSDRRSRPGRMAVSANRVCDLLGSRGERLDAEVLNEIAEDAPLVAEVTGVHVDCAVKVLGSLDSWDLSGDVLDAK